MGDYAVTGAFLGPEEDVGSAVLKTVEDEKQISGGSGAYRGGARGARRGGGGPQTRRRCTTVTSRSSPMQVSSSLIIR